MRRADYETTRSITNFVFRYGKNGRVPLFHDNLDTVRGAHQQPWNNLSEASGSRSGPIPSYRTVQRQIREMIGFLTSGVVEARIAVDTKKAGARVTARQALRRNSSQGECTSEATVKIIMPSEHAKMDLATFPTWNAMRSNSEYLDRVAAVRHRRRNAHGPEASLFLDVERRIPLSTNEGSASQSNGAFSVTRARSGDSISMSVFGVSGTSLHVACRDFIAHPASLPVRTDDRICIQGRVVALFKVDGSPSWRFACRLLLDRYQSVSISDTCLADQNTGEERSTTNVSRLLLEFVSDASRADTLLCALLSVSSHGHATSRKAEKC